MDASRQSKSSDSLGSWWVVLAFIPFLNWLPFIYIGFRTGYSTWTIWGLVYALPSFLWVVADSLVDVLVIPWFGLWMVSIYHAFRVRAEYRRRLDAKKGVLATPSTVPSSQPVSWAQTQAVSVSDAPPPQSPVDVNNASEEVIAAMPGIGSVLAKKAVNERQKRGGFKSTEEFGQALGLMPHIVERIRPIVVISPLPAADDPQTNSGRVVDV